MSGEPTIKGTNQFPKPPIITGITRKNNIIKACAVTIVLYNWLLFNKGDPGCLNSIRIIRLRLAPISPDQIPAIK